MPVTVSIFGIRHHGPGSARSVERALARLKPAAVLIEGPPDAAELIPLAGSDGFEPPVAILVYEPDNSASAAYWPFAEFSPEWRALKWALANSAQARFIDLPYASRALPSESATPESDEPEAEAGPAAAADPDPRRDPLDHLAHLAGYPDGERWWDHLVESRRGDDESLFSAIAEAMAALRASLPGPRDADEPIREAHMRRAIRTAQKEGFERIAVVCGAWHAPALAAMPPAKDDDALLKGLPKRKVAATWVPWTHGRLTFASGYGAGIHSPGWYEHLWRHADLASERWMTRVVRLLRDEGLDASSAHAIESVRLADSLASLRGRAIAGLEELTEATLSVACGGNPLPLAVIERKLIVGERLGRVPDDCPAVPLQRDLARLQTSLRLKPSADEKPLDLDQRKETDLERSRLLHRLSLLGIPWGTLQSSGGRTSTFHEVWVLQWQPEFALTLIERAVWGNTVQGAAESYAIHLARESKELAAVAGLLDHALLADLPRAAEAITRRIEELAAVAADIGLLMDALPALARALRYGNVRQTDAAMLGHTVRGLTARIAAGLVPACASLDDDAAAEMLGRIDSSHAALARLQDPALTSLWQEALARLAAQGSIHGLVSGRASRILLDAGALPAGDAAARLSLSLSPGADPAAAAAWAEGFLSGSGLVLLHDQQLWSIIDAWLSGLAPANFDQVLPLIRRTFGTFAAGERRQISERVRASSSLAAPSASAESDFDPVRAQAVLPVLRLLLGNPNL